jgi:hypothetical protein
MKFKILYLFFMYSFIGCKGQDTFGTDHLKLIKTIAMPGVNGRIDHMAINVKDQVLYVAALGNNSVEIIDLKNGVVVHSITALDEPQGIAYIPDHNEIVVANGGNGNVIFYNASTYAVKTTIHLAGDADNVRYNASVGKIYVGYGEGGIAVIDVATHKQIEDVKLSAHPESFQLDLKNERLFVNLPDAKSIAVIDLSNMKLIDTWKTNKLDANFPMALDTTGNSIMIGYRHPAAMITYDAATGKELNRTDLISDIDDIFYYDAKQLVFASGGGGAINIFKKDNTGTYKKLANVPVRSGARTSLLVPSMHIYALAERANGSKQADVLIYTIND